METPRLSALLTFSCAASALPAAIANAMPIANAQLVLLVHLEVLEWMAPLANLANQVLLEKITLPQTTAALEDLSRQSLSHQDKAPQDHLVPQAQLDPKEPQVLQAKQAVVADKDHLDHQAQLAQLAAMANLVPKGHLEKMRLEERDRKDQRDHLDLLDHLAPRDHLADQPLAAAELANLDHPAHLDHLVEQAILASKAHKAHPETQAQMPNIVLAHHAVAWSIAVVLSLCSATSTKQPITMEETSFMLLVYLFLRRCRNHGTAFQHFAICPK